MTLGGPFSPLTAMLGIRAGSKVCLIRPPGALFERLGALPPGVELLESARTGLDVILFFPKDAASLVQQLPPLMTGMTLTGGLWVFWPPAEEAASGLSEAFIRQVGLDAGLVDDKVCVLDTRWVGLRFVWRRRPRLERPPRAEL